MLPSLFHPQAYKILLETGLEIGKTNAFYYSNGCHRKETRNVWVPDFMQEGFHNSSPGDFEITLIKAGSDTKEGLKIEEARSWQPD